MTCYHPLHGYHCLTNNGIVFSPGPDTGRMMAVPCGQCIGCRLDRSRDWAVRCYHESQLHKENCFLTLTYNDECLPYDGSLNVKHFQDFMKRLRKAVYPRMIRFFHCGEYGSQTFRPHYHAVLFGLDFDDKYLWAERNGYKVFRSEFLESKWEFGNSELGTCTFESAGYCARYLTKKVTGRKAEEHYERVIPETGEVVHLQPEYTTMSRRPGLGSGWFDKYWRDIYPADYVVVNSVKFPIPRYYDRLLESVDVELYRQVKERRMEQMMTDAAYLENLDKRLVPREKVKQAQARQLKRNL